MDLTLSGTAFLQKLQSVSRAQPYRGINLQGDVELHVYGSGAVLISREADTWARRALSAAVARTGSVCFPGRAVVALLEGMGGSLRILREDHVVRFESSNGRAVEIPTGTPPERREPPVLRDAHLTVPLQALMRGFRQVVHAQGRRVDSLSWSRGVHLLDTAEGLRLTACDGFRLASVVIPKLGTSVFECSLPHPGVILTSHGPGVILDLLHALDEEGEALVDIEEIHGSALLFKGRNNDKDRVGVGLLMVTWPKPAEPGTPPAVPDLRCDAERFRQEINYVLGSRSSERSDPTIELRYTPLSAGKGTLKVSRQEEATGVKTEASLTVDGASKPFYCQGNGTFLATALRGFRFDDKTVSVKLGADPRNHHNPRRKILQLYTPELQHLCEVGVTA